MSTLGDELRARADAKDIPLRTIKDVRETLAEAARTGADGSMARLMRKHGRLTADALAYVEDYERKAAQ